MRLNKLYEKINALVSLEIFNYGDSQKNLESEFAQEFLYLNNMQSDKFSEEPENVQFDILKLYDVYYRNGNPLITDKDYDLLFSIYSKHNGEETAPIMFEPSVNAWKKETHSMPMGSLDKQSTIDEIEKWNNKPGIKGKSIVISEKLDGISLEAIYEKGKFVKAITRGDGKQGDDITENAIYFNGMVKELQEPWDCSIRGEVVITKENLGKINTILVEYGKEPLKNTRNGVSGQATRYKDRNEDILSLITFLAYEVQVYKVHETGNNVL